MSKYNKRIVIPKKAPLLIILADLIIAKHVLDGEASLLNNIDMDAMATANIIAKEQDVLAVQLDKDKERAVYERDYSLGIAKGQEAGMPGTVMYFIKASREILLGLYKGHEHDLGEWGFVVNRSKGTVSIAIPLNANEIITLAKQILAKNTAEGVDSPIKGLNIVDFTAKTTYADEQNILARQLMKDKERAYDLRDQKLGFNEKSKLSTSGTIRFFVTQVRDVLLGFKKGTESELGDWGFEVNSGPTPPSGKKSLTGTVSDEAGVIISDAVLTLIELNATVNSGSTGIYSFYNKPAGTYTLRVLKPGYVALNKPGIVITQGVTTTQNIKLLESGGTLTVSVFAEGAPLVNAAVKILETGVEILTSEEGTATFNNIAAGDYNIEVTAPGYQPQTKPVTITSGVSDMLIFEMIPG